MFRLKVIAGVLSVCGFFAWAAGGKSALTAPKSFHDLAPIAEE